MESDKKKEIAREIWIEIEAEIETEIGKKKGLEAFGALPNPKNARMFDIFKFLFFKTLKFSNKNRMPDKCLKFRN